MGSNIETRPYGGDRKSTNGGFLHVQSEQPTSALSPEAPVATSAKPANEWRNSQARRLAFGSELFFLFEPSRIWCGQSQHPSDLKSNFSLKYWYWKCLHVPRAAVTPASL